MGNKKQINPRNLISLRDMASLSQVALSEKSGVSVRTINKIENEEEPVEVQGHIFEKLRKALKCSPVELTRTNGTQRQDQKFTQISIDEATSVNLNKVSEEYNVSINEIINLAPLLFADIAEKCLDKEADALALDELKYLERFTNFPLESDHLEGEEDIVDILAEFTVQSRKAIKNKDVLFKTCSFENTVIGSGEYVFSLDEYVPLNEEIIPLLNSRRMMELFDKSDLEEFLYGIMARRYFAGSRIKFYQVNDNEVSK